MQIRLKILHGTLKSKRGEATLPEVVIASRRFLIGSAEDCSMRCPSKTVNRHHCEILSDANRVALRVLAGDAGTFVNQERVSELQALKHGDHLQIGRLEFEVLIDREAATVEPSKPDGSSNAAEDVGESISEMLSAADLREQERRKRDPESRQFHLPETHHEAPAEEDAGEQKPAKRKKKQPPRKLPKPPPTSFEHAEDSTEAAEEALRKLFSR